MGNKWSHPQYDEYGPVDLAHFRLHRSIGRGAFGKVKIVEHRPSNQMFALKYINKEMCIKKKASKNIIRERKMLEALRHPFIVNLWFAFQDDEHMFMVLDLMLGGDLRFHLNKLQRFKEETVRFYAAELTSAIIYLHNNRIIHRDIKPDNILIDSHGHVHLTDFNCTGQIACSPSSSTAPNAPKLSSCSGTHGYIAPEVYRGSYAYEADWWSLGIVLFELLTGKKPFHSRSLEKLKGKVKYGTLKWNEDIQNELSDEIKDFVEKLLERDVNVRLGDTRPSTSILDHPILQKVDWDALLKKEITPPYIPNPKKLNFDVSYELEELLLEENPLSPSPRRGKKKKKSKSTASPQSGSHSDDVAFENHDGLEAETKSPSPPSPQKILEIEFKYFDFSKRNISNHLGSAGNSRNNSIDYTDNKPIMESISPAKCSKNSVGSRKNSEVGLDITPRSTSLNTKRKASVPNIKIRDEQITVADGEREKEMNHLCAVLNGKSALMKMRKRMDKLSRAAKDSGKNREEERRKNSIKVERLIDQEMDSMKAILDLLDFDSGVEDSNSSP
ncbi:kinase-like domain-containing protein [Paraphysoderma sedebokerense]|nr:kinase-like domain-containing protein [Paraphysoderma sedebokerense]